MQIVLLVRFIGTLYYHCCKEWRRPLQLLLHFNKKLI